MKFFSKENLPTVLLFLALAIVTVSAVYILFRPAKSTYVTEFYQLDETTNEFKKVSGNPHGPTILDINPNSSSSAPSITKILKGYFHEYNTDNQQLQLKNKFLDSSYLQLLTVSLSQVTQFYCWPEITIGNTGPVQTKNMEFYIYPNGQDIVMPEEKSYSLDLLGDFLKLDHYLIIQLKDTFYLNSDNQVQKLILLGC